MTAFLQTAAVLCLTVLCGAAGLRASKWPKPWPTIAAAVPLCVVCLIGAARHYKPLLFVPPLSVLVPGRVKFIVLSASIAMMFSASIPHTKPRRKRVMLWILTCVFVLYAAVPPFMGPELVRRELRNLTTTTTADGVCLQTTQYTCGPASAVTALRRWGLAGDESTIALHAGTSPVTGTEPDMLVAALRRLYTTSGLQCEFRRFGSVKELIGREPVLVITRYGPMVDHYVTVLAVTRAEVVVGDPLSGRRRYTHESFRRIWRGTGIVLKRVEVAEAATRRAQLRGAGPPQAGSTRELRRERYLAEARQ